MNELHSTIRELLVAAEKEFSSRDAIRFKVKSDDGSGKKAVKVAGKTYTELKNDSECFSAALAALVIRGLFPSSGLQIAAAWLCRWMRCSQQRIYVS